MKKNNIRNTILMGLVLVLSSSCASSNAKYREKRNAEKQKMEATNSKQNSPGDNGDNNDYDAIDDVADKASPEAIANAEVIRKQIIKEQEGLVNCYLSLELDPKKNNGPVKARLAFVVSPKTRKADKTKIIENSHPGLGECLEGHIRSLDFKNLKGKKSVDVNQLFQFTK